MDGCIDACSTIEQPPKDVFRTLVLVGKALQMLANRFRGRKEDYILFLTPFIESHLPHLDTFMDNVAVCCVILTRRH